MQRKRGGLVPIGGSFEQSERLADPGFEQNH